MPLRRLCGTSPRSAGCGFDDVGRARRPRPSPCRAACAAVPEGLPCVMGRQLEIGALRPGSYQLARSTPTFGCRDQLRRYAAHEGERSNVRADPVGQRLRPARLGIV